MQNSTRALFNAYLERVASLNGIKVEDLSKKFALDPTISQKLETRIQESSDFLQKINIFGVSEQEGEKVGLGVSGTIAGTTDTTKNDRKTRDMSALDARRYRAEQTNFDTHTRYAQLDAWAKFPDFQTRMRDEIVRRQALDRICIGFNGVKRSLDSDRAANPLLQDVNKGWLQQYRETAAARVIKDIQVGTGKTYANLDAMVFDLVSSLIDPWHQEDPDMVVICGRQLLTAKYFPALNGADNQKNTERVAADVILSSQRIGGLPAMSVPYFPAKSLMVTSLKNLSIYWQEGTRRRTIVENAKRDQVENYESVNEGYVVEDLGAGCVAENITLS